jgi:hypothetical protein
MSTVGVTRKRDYCGSQKENERKIEPNGLSAELGRREYRACLDCRIFTGFLEGAVPKERKYVGAFGTRERRFPFRRKGNKLRAFHRKKASGQNQ